MSQDAVRQPGTEDVSRVTVSKMVKACLCWKRLSWIFFLSDLLHFYLDKQLLEDANDPTQTFRGGGV